MVGHDKRTLLEMAVKLVKLTLLKTDLQLNRLSTVCTIKPGPSSGRRVCFLDKIRGASLDRRGKSLVGGGSSQENRGKDVHFGQDWWRDVSKTKKQHTRTSRDTRGLEGYLSLVKK